MTIPVPTSGSVAIVTGASSGIGSEFARQLAARGHDLVLVARRTDRLDALADELRRTGRRIECIGCDLSDTGQRAALVTKVSELGLTPDVLVLNAGMGMGGPFVGQEADRLQLLLRTNIEGVVMLARSWAPDMVARQRGAILIVSSVVGEQPIPGIGVYAASKAAVTSFAEMLHQELRPSGVTVTVLCPGEVLTDFADSAAIAEMSDRVPAMLKISATDCARAGLTALDSGQRKAIPLAMVRLQGWLGRNAPRGIWLRLSSSIGR